MSRPQVAARAMVTLRPTWAMPITRMSIVSVDACRKMKIRCIDKENPPCKRCRNMKLECKFAPVVVRMRLPGEDIGDTSKSRLDLLEGQVSNMNRKLDDISTFLLRMPMAQSTSAPAAPAPAPAPAPTGPRSQSADGSSPRYDQRQSAERSPSNSNLIARQSSWATSTHHLKSTPSVVYANSTPSDTMGAPSDHYRTAPTRSPLSRAPRSNSEEDDPLESAVRMEAFRGLTDREEEVRLRDEGGGAIDESEGLHYRPTLHPNSSLRSTKRRRALDDDGWSQHSPKDKMRQGTDPIELGLCSESEGKELFDRFFAFSHQFVPILDPREDTWDELRRRSPFLLTVLLLAAARAREGAGPPSPLSKRFKEHCEHLARLTLFSPVSALETVQALTLLTCWGDSTWRLCCHATTIAVDMGLFKCIPYLLRMRDSWNKSPEFLERQRPLIIGARIWLALVKLTYEMSLNYHLPLPFPAPTHFKAEQTRAILDHPLATTLDARFMVSVELLQVREPLLRPYDADAVRDPAEVDHQLREINHQIRTIYEHWCDHYHRIGVPDDHFLVEELGRHRAYATIYANSVALVGVREPSEVSSLSLERRQWLGSAVRAAAYLVASIGSDHPERAAEFVTGNHFFYVGVVAMARYLIRMVSLFPEVCDLHQVSFDIDKLLRKMPEFSFVEMLRATLARSRRQGILPYTPLSHPSPEDPAPPRPVQEPQNGEEQQPPLNFVPMQFPWGGLEQGEQLGQMGGVNEMTDDVLGMADLAAWFPLGDAQTPLDLDGISKMDAQLESWISGAWYPGAGQA
ncbi:Protein priB [Vanrija pseudolonga]|uniref:Protein priB n=1 Tax=Vanrija pseudolonga TaxID=143232 RepID=A0AAF1BJV3_9TREE|nr:Protein priB [Vanrija pseudolonga]